MGVSSSEVEKERPRASGDVAMPLGEHLFQATRDKILNGECIDLFLLLYCEIEKNDKDMMDDKEKEVLKKRKEDQPWANWLVVFLIFAGVIVKEHPNRGAALSQCLDIVFKACVMLLVSV